MRIIEERLFLSGLYPRVVRVSLLYIMKLRWLACLKTEFFSRRYEIDYGKSGTELVLCFYWYSRGNYWYYFCAQTNPPSSLYGIMTASLPYWRWRLADVEAKLWSVGVCMEMMVSNHNNFIRISEQLSAILTYSYHILEHMLSVPK